MIYFNEFKWHENLARTNCTENIEKIPNLSHLGQPDISAAMASFKYKVTLVVIDIIMIIYDLFDIRLIKSIIKGANKSINIEKSCSYGICARWTAYSNSRVSNQYAI